jgi:hypothetical protein
MKIIIDEAYDQVVFKLFNSSLNQGYFWILSGIFVRPSAIFAMFVAFILPHITPRLRMYTQHLPSFVVNSVLIIVA